MDTIAKAVEKRKEDRREGAGRSVAGVAPESSAWQSQAEQTPGLEHRRQEPLDPSGEARSITLLKSKLAENIVVGADGRDALQITEEFRYIKRPLLLNAEGKGGAPIDHGNLVMVTSSLSGEGKTFTALNLALSIASERGKTVLLVDADVAKPTISVDLGMRDRPGLIEVLTDDSVRIQDALLRTEIPNITLLPAGGRHQHATELLASEAMRRLADEISTRYSDRIVVFDSPPLLLTSESQVLAALMGQIVLVVEESRTSQQVLQRALSRVNKDQIVGLVLNKSHQRVGSGYYGGYGYYGYGR